MSDTTTTDTLPEVWQDENANFYWCEGHVEPGLFVLACVVDTRINCGPDDVLDFLGDRLDTASQVRAVQHGWFRQDPTDEEQFLPCKVDAVGALPFTQLPL